MALMDMVVNGLLLAVGALALYTLVVFGASLARDDTDLREAGMMTFTRLGAVVGGAFTAGATGLVEVADILGMIGMLVSQHPFAVSNLGILALGGAIISGFLSLSTAQYVGIGLGLFALVMVLTEVNADAR